jgi:hypothetical protein
MIKKTINFLLDFLKIYFLGGFVSSILLLYLVLSDPYFEKLDFKNQNYVIKLEKYFLFVFYIPLWILFFYSIFLVLRNKLWFDKLICLGYASLGIFLFYVCDLRIKHMLVISNKIVFNIIVVATLYLMSIFICVKLKKCK